MTDPNLTDCCPPFNPIPWDNQIIEWRNKLFIKDKVYCLLNMPLNFGKVMTRIVAKTEQHGVKIPEWLCLSDHTSIWNMDLYIAVDKEIPHTENVKISGNFYSLVYEGDFRKTGEWMADFKKKTIEKQITTGKMYMWYTTCPKCAKKYGKNYVVILAEIK